MHWGVPFRTTPRRELTEQQQAIVDETSDRLIGLREAYQRCPAEDLLELVLSHQEAALLIAVVEDCLRECGRDPTELRLQLKTSDRQAVEDLLERLRQCLEAPSPQRA